jgi:uncharacterized protein YidB (DUF937 family)
MGFLDDIIGKVTGGGTSGGLSALAPAVLDMLQNHPGGLGGLLSSFQSQGLGHIISSWIGTGENLPISADQLQRVLGSDTLKNLAARAGIPPEQIGASLSQLLPHMVDNMTPDGKIPDGQ